MQLSYSQAETINHNYNYLKSLDLTRLCELLSDKTQELLTAKADKNLNHVAIGDLKATVEKIQAVIISRKDGLRSL